ncbi:hypothetical protein H4R18_001584 [Coemansia javaensis]|uniref:THUMP domain-containing protein n=1 Tax=Coemansia javaensis TaxID=2761396 RepID=A0A9W8HFA1_9FUNG|nr:hypothetical protein H4R18_001584 [Coemansia javaensis]
MGKRAGDRPGAGAGAAAQQKRARRHQSRSSRFKNPQNSFDISPGMKGFFATCTRGRERSSAAEAIDLLESYAARLYPGLEEEVAAAEAEPEPEPGAESGDIEAEIAREVAEMKSASKPALFRYLPTTIECLIYIKCHRRIDPGRLVQFMFADLVETRQRRTRFTGRLVPAQVTTTSKVDAIVKAAKAVAHDLLADDAAPTTFALVVNIRYCDDIKRDDVIPAVAAPLDAKHKVDLKHAKHTIVIEIFKSMATVGLVQDYNALRRLNLQTLFDEPRPEALKPPSEPTA